MGLCSSLALELRVGFTALHPPYRSYYSILPVVLCAKHLKGGHDSKLD